MVTATPTDDLSRAVVGETFNLYRHGRGAIKRRVRLRRYISARNQASVRLVGEAARYRSVRVSEILFISERQLYGERPSETSATVVHRVPHELGIEGEVLLWNIVPTHPHARGRPDSNRRPTRDEIDGGTTFLHLLASGRLLIPAGRMNQSIVGGHYVRRPAHGGATLFEEHLVAVLRQNGVR